VTGSTCLLRGLTPRFALLLSVHHMPPKVRDILRLMEQDGWFLVATGGSQD
jgi:hypothetical protein